MNRLSPKLLFLLGILGMSVSHLHTAQADAIVVCERHLRTGEYAGDIDIVAQRISPLGEIIWQEGTQSIAVAAGTHAERNPQAIPNSSGGLIVAFETEARTGDRAGDSEIRCSVFRELAPETGSPSPNSPTQTPAPRTPPSDRG